LKLTDESGWAAVQWTFEKVAINFKELLEHPKQQGVCTPFGITM
jgi:hypothetical protein